MRILLVNTSANTGSTGRISEEIGRTARAAGYECWSAYGRTARDSQHRLIRIGSDWDIRWHGVQSRLLDNHGFASTSATKAFVRKLDEIRPDIVNLHNVHGYYLNVGVLLKYLAERDIPVVWTFHDCWPLTGHCSYFDAVDCSKWKSGCGSCPNKRGYPECVGIDRSKANYDKKNKLIHGLKHLTIVTPSKWLSEIVAESYLSEYPVRVINNGVDLDAFKPATSLDILDKIGLKPNKRLLLGVANTWDKRKGLGDFVEISKIMPSDWQMLLVGLSKEQVRELPSNIKGITRTENVQQLAELYSYADVFVNPTYVDNFPTTNIEALACGTPVITYNTGGSPEAIDEKTGMVVEKGNINELKSAINTILQQDRDALRQQCRWRAERLYNKQDRFDDYVKLFNEITDHV